MLAFKKTILTALSVSLLSGCFSLKDDDDDDTAVTTTSLSGKVADGYLSDAKVCLDLNKNKVCDDGEPSTISTAGGEFSLDGVTQAQLDSAPLLVEIIPGQTVDADNPGVPIAKKYTLTAPAGYEFISPLTTMVQSEIENNGVSPEQAEGSVQAKLGTTLNLKADYVAGSAENAGSDSDRNEFKRLHKVAQVTVVVMQNNIKLVEDVLEGTEASFEDLLGVIVSQVLDALATISNEVTTSDAAATEENPFDPNAVAVSDTVENEAKVDAANIEEDIAEREAARETIAANIATLLDSGESIHIFRPEHESDSIFFGYETITKNIENFIDFIFSQYDPESELWVAQTEDDNDGTEEICILESGAFTCVDDDTESIDIDENKVIIQIGSAASTRTEITGVSVNLTGKRIQNFLAEDFRSVINPAAVFTEGAVGYKLSFNRTQDMYALFKANVDNAAECWQDHNQDQEDDSAGGDTEEDTGGTDESFSPTDVWCNNVFVRTGDGDHSTDGAAATSLADIISATAAVNPSNVENIKGTTVNGGRDFEIMAEFVTGGVVNYYVVKYDHNQGDQADQGASVTIDPKIVGSWKQQTFGSQLLMIYTLPAVLAELGDFRADERTQFFNVQDGYLRFGGIQPKGIESQKEWVINDAGRDQVLAAFDYDLKADLAACSTGDVDFDPDNVAEEPGATAAEFVTAAENCQDVEFGATELVGKTLVTDFGFLNFKAAGAGVFLGEVGDNKNTVLNFTWAVNGAGHIVINTQAIESAATVHLRLTIAKVSNNARQIRVVTFDQEAATAAELDTVNGSIFGEVWGLN